MFIRNSIAVLCLSQVLSLQAMPGGRGAITTSFNGQEAAELKKEILQSSETHFYIRAQWQRGDQPMGCELGAYGRNTYADVTDCFYERTQFVPLQYNRAKSDQNFCGIGNHVGEKTIIHSPMANYGVSRPDMLIALNADEYRILENVLVSESEKNLKCLVVDSD